jgi:transposase InsO family protein
MLRAACAIERLLTNNGSAYRFKLFAQTRQALGIKHRFTRPYRPQTNGKAERFIQLAGVNGLTPEPTPTAPNAPPGCLPSSPTTTPAGPIQRSATNFQPLASAVQPLLQLNS